ncbi:SWIM zinc finger family protein [Halocatena halophila]|uniref:SWIM zinc finger family protein n=1 Tax=Halocatena halophila TaxID=2814576 RepID=UPI0038B245E6
MDVEPFAPGLYRVTREGTDYTVDLQQTRCECPDFRYRSVVCKHIIRAALWSFYSDDDVTTIVARTLEVAHNTNCPAENDRICDGPLGPRYPCPECVSATGWDDWTIWKQTARRTGEHRGE